MKTNLMKSAFLVLVSSMLLTGCRNDQEFARVHAESDDPFTVTTNLEETKEIHTERQKAYLSYQSNYAEIPEANYPDGLQHLSDPEAVNLAWSFSPADGKTVSRYDVKIGKEADLSDGYIVQGSSTASLDIYNSYLGDNYFQIIANYSDGTKSESAIKKYKVDEQYPRNLRIDGMTNCRDMGGGRTLENGGKIKQGMIFRTSATNSWGNGNAVVPDNITNDGKAELLQHLGCKTEIDVNNSGSNRVGVQNYVDAYMYYDGGKHHLYRNSEPIKAVFNALSNPDNYPVFYHCRIGTDRTGLCAILISGLLGVSENEIYQDYLFSNFGNIQEKRYIGEKAGRDNILNYINDLKAFPGEKFHNKVYNYLLSIGISAEKLNSVIDILTEGNKAEGNDNQQEVVLASEFEAEGATLQTSNNRAHPSNYYTLGAEQSVTAEFNPEYSASAKLVAYLGSTNSSSSLKIGESISVTLDGSEVEIDDITFADAGFGTGASRTYYAAIVLGDVNIVKGATEVVVTGIANNLNIGALAIIPTEAVSPSGNNGGSAKGCFGSITAASSLIALISVAGVGIILLKKKKEQE